MRVFLRSILLGAVFGVFGHALIGFGFLRPAAGEAVNRVDIHATGTKNANSKGAEVWFRGAFEIGENKKIPWDRFEVDTSWVKRDGIYISHLMQPGVASLKFKGLIRMHSRRTRIPGLSY